MTYQTSKKFKKAALLISVFLLVSVIYPLFQAPRATNVSTAADEIRFTKGAKVARPSLGQDFISWIEYRDGAYNAYAYNFKTREEKKLNKVPLAVDALGPVASQIYVYWVDHIPSGWVFTKYDLNHDTLVEMKTETNTVHGFNVFDKNIVYSAIKGSTTDVFAFDWYNTNSRNLTDDEKYQGVPSIFEDMVAFSEYSTACAPVSGKEFELTCKPAKTGNVVTYNLTTGIRKTLQENVPELSQVQSQYNTLAWSQKINDKKVVQIFYIYGGSIFTVSPTDYDSYNPTLSPGLVVYSVNRSSGADLDYFKFGVNERGTLSWNQAKKSQITISPTDDKIAWIDDRLATEDIYYYDFQADGSKNDQDIDGLSDATEALKGSNPFDFDTDHDGLTDYEEVVTYKTYSTQYDSDADGLTDGEEVKTWHSNPLAFDTDKDGYDDKTEIAMGHSPVVAGRTLLMEAISEFVQPVAFIYGKPRLNDLTIERQMALELRQQLDKMSGAKRLQVKGAKEWYKVVNAYIYGNYSVQEIAQYLRGNRYALSNTVLAEQWRNSQAQQDAKLHAAVK